MIGLHDISVILNAVKNDRDRQFCIKEGLSTSEKFKNRDLLVFSGSTIQLPIS